MSKGVNIPGESTYLQVLKRGEEILLQFGVPEASLNAWYLFSHCFDMERSRFFLKQEEEAPVELCQKYGEMLEKRGKRIPLEHITNETEFMGLPFYVDGRVLIPRQDTECLVEEVLPYIKGKKVLDMCTGSGCIGISLFVCGEPQEVTLADISEDALAVAEENAKRNNAAVTICQSDLFQNIEGKFDIIVSNPPYIAKKEIAGLMPEVREHDPVLALDGGEDGLDFYRRMIEKASDYLEENGRIFFEIGYDQGEELKKILKLHGFTEVEIKKDLAGLDRIAMGKRKENGGLYV